MSPGTSGRAGDNSSTCETSSSTGWVCLLDSVVVGVLLCGVFFGVGGPASRHTLKGAAFFPQLSQALDGFFFFFF